MKRLILTLALLSPVSAQAIDANDVMRMADVMYCEAKGEGRIGMLAVGDVVMNRVNDKRWPNTIKGVIEQPKQFSCIGTALVINNPKAYELAVELAAMVITGQSPRITHANHYYAHNKIKTPVWANNMARLGEIGNHRFYKH